MRKPKRVIIRGPVVPGCKVLREAPPGDRPWPKQFRFYNPDGGPFQMEVDLSPWIQGRLKDGDIEIVEASAPKLVIDPPADRGKGKGKPAADKE